MKLFGSKSITGNFFYYIGHVIESLDSLSHSIKSFTYGPLSRQIYTFSTFREYTRTNAYWDKEFRQHFNYWMKDDKTIRSSCKSSLYNTNRIRYTIKILKERGPCSFTKFKKEAENFMI